MSDEEWTAADDVVEEVREARRRIWERCDNDPGKYMAYIREFHVRLVRAGWEEVPRPNPCTDDVAGSAGEDQPANSSWTGADDVSEEVREARRTKRERLLDNPRKLLAFFRELEEQLVREGFIKADPRSRGRAKSAA